MDSGRVAQRKKENGQPDMNAFSNLVSSILLKMKQLSAVTPTAPLFNVASMLSDHLCLPRVS